MDIGLLTMIAAGWAALMLLTYGYILIDTLCRDRDFIRKWNVLKEALTEE